MFKNTCTSKTKISYILVVKDINFMVTFQHKPLIDLKFCNHSTLYSKVTPLKYHVFKNIMENGAFAHLEQMLHFQ